MSEYQYVRRDLHDEAIAKLAERNGELHVLCHSMLTELESLGSPNIHKYREILHAVPQLR